MPDFRFLHAADIHLDSPMRGLERYPDAPVDVVRNAPRRAFENLIEFALDEDVAFVLLAGDLYDGEWRDYHTGLFFVRQMRRLDDAGIPVFLVSGNHDATSRITRRLSLPGNVKHFRSASPETATIEELGVAIHGQSFADRSVSEDLSAGYPSAEPGRLDIGLLHTSLDGREGHADYAPCTLAGLQSRDYDYWALGHVHAREVVSDAPWVVFPGNLQGRHVREIGAKGASLVRVEGGRIVDVSHRSLDVLRWAHVRIDLEDAEDGEGAIERARECLELEAERAEGRLVAARVALCGRTAAHAELTGDVERWQTELREVASRIGGEGVWIERISFETASPVDFDSVVGRGDALGEMLQRIVGLDASPHRLASLGAEFAPLAKKLPAAVREGSGSEPGFDPTDENTLRALLPAARAQLLSRLLDAGADD